MAKSGEHIVPSPEGVAAFVHATGLSMRQLLNDMRIYWGPKEYAEYNNLMRAKLALTPEDYELINLCHAINLAWSDARQRAMIADRAL